jgi:hypothetical protein
VHHADADAIVSGRAFRDECGRVGLTGLRLTRHGIEHRVVAEGVLEELLVDDLDEVGQQAAELSVAPDAVGQQRVVIAGQEENGPFPFLPLKLRRERFPPVALG